jgi:hypothetical protein
MVKRERERIMGEYEWSETCMVNLRYGKGRFDAAAVTQQQINLSLPSC